MEAETRGGGSDSGGKGDFVGSRGEVSVEYEVMLCGRKEG